MRVEMSAVFLLAVVTVSLPDRSVAWLFGSSQSGGSGSSTASRDIPDSCYNPRGDACTWYADCLERKIPCKGTTDDYAIAYAKKYCELYQQRRGSFSRQGQRWVDGVRKCLQVKLAPELRKTPSPSCSYVKTTAFRSHVPCYLAPSGAPSFCDLSFQDQFQVFWTIKGAFLNELIDTISGGAQVGGSCTLQAVKNVYDRIRPLLG